MKRPLILFTSLLLLYSSATFASSPAEPPQSAQVRKDVEATLDLWREGRYDELYHRVIESGGHTREYFVSHLAAAPRKPSCCWEKLQEVRVTGDDERRATLHGKFGFDTGSGAEFMTKGVKLEKDGGIWKMKMSEVLALSGAGKKMRGAKKSHH